MSLRYLDDVKAETLRRFSELQRSLGVAETIIEEKACVYATGSFGRLEAGPQSDLDLFIVIDTEKKGEGPEVRRLDGIAEAKVKFYLISAVETGGIAKFDAGGRYLESHARDDFTRHLGSQEDDFRNTLTGRLLLLLESRALLGNAFYDDLLEGVILAYYQDYTEKTQGSFQPSFLVNDILRLWRTFCVNYEFARRKGSADIKLKNLKLKYSRMLTCYSGVMHLLAAHVEKGTVSPEDVRRMVSLTPIERLKDVQSRNVLSPSRHKDLESLIAGVLEEYSNFLSFVHRPKDEALAEYVADPAKWGEASYRFGHGFAEALETLGTSDGKFDTLYRMVVI